MSNNLLEYKGYHATVEFSSDDCLLFGKVCWINDSLTFEGGTTQEIVAAFHETIDEYLTLCEEVGKNPDKEFKGTFNVRMSPDLHRAASVAAATGNKTLNQFIVDSVAASIHEDNQHACNIADMVADKLSSRNVGMISVAIPYQVKVPYPQDPIKYVTRDVRSRICQYN